MNGLWSRKMLSVTLIVVTLLAAGCTGFTTPKQTPKQTSGQTSGQTPGQTPAQTPPKSDNPTAFSGEPAKIPIVSVFPREATVDLDRPNLLLRANIDSQAIDTKTHTAQWSLGGVVMSTETTLTAAPFVKAINNLEGTYTVRLTVLTKAGTKIGESTATVVAKKDKPIIVSSNHYASAVAGKGMRYWTAWSDGAEWWEGDADLRVKGTTGTLTMTIVSSSQPAPELSMIGQTKVFTFSDWKDNGTNVTFSYKAPTGQVYAFRLAWESNGQILKGTMDAPEMKIQSGTLPGMKGSLNLRQVP